MMIKQTLYTATVASTLLIGGIAHAEVPHTFSAGEPARAAQVNENFSQLDTRLTPLENPTVDGPTIAVDCATDVTAFKTLTPTPNATYVLSGICEGPVFFDNPSLGTITIQGDENGGQDDGIALPADLLTRTDFDHFNRDFAALWGNSGVRLQLENIRVSADGFQTDAADNPSIRALWAGRGAHIILENVSIVGGDIGAEAAGGYYSMLEGVSISGFGETGLDVNSGGLAHAFFSVTITGATTEFTGDYSEAVLAWRNGSIYLSQGATLTPAVNTANDFEGYAVTAIDNGTVRIEDGGTDSRLNGIVGAFRSSMVRIVDVDAVITGNLWSGESSSMLLDGVMQTGDVEVFRVGSLRIIDSSIAGGSGDAVSVGGASALRLDNTTVGNQSGTGTIESYRYGAINIRGSSDLNGRRVCGDEQGINIRDSVVNVGSCS